MSLKTLKMAKIFISSGKMEVALSGNAHILLHGNLSVHVGGVHDGLRGVHIKNNLSEFKNSKHLKLKDLRV